GLPLALRRRVLRRAAYLLQGDEPALEARHIALLELLIAAPTPAHAVHLPGEVYATLDARGKLVMRRSILARLDPTTTPPAPPEALSVPLPVPGRAVLPGSGWQVRAMLLDPAAGASPPGTEHPAPGASGAGRGLRPAAGTAADAGQAQLRAYLDADAAGTSLTVRAWRPGDRFRPLGMTGEKKVQDYFVDARVPRAERASIPLVWGPTHLLWIAGHRLDDRVKLTAATRRVLALRLEPAHLLESSPDLLTEVVEP
ncbi:MAG TPA: tRNA lysidine(34) synthetase TilS, partial [Ktedonobacterales bacterium]|nr:tRNA lysidine(34) synthetase TilS [Ktedonobacterales bacterium]